MSFTCSARSSSFSWRFLEAKAAFVMSFGSDCRIEKSGLEAVPIVGRHTVGFEASCLESRLEVGWWLMKLSFLWCSETQTHSYLPELSDSAFSLMMWKGTTLFSAGTATRKLDILRSGRAPDTPLSVTLFFALPAWNICKEFFRTFCNCSHETELFSQLVTPSWCCFLVVRGRQVGRGIM